MNPEFLVHGVFGLKIAYDDAIVSDSVRNSIERGSYEKAEGRRLLSFVDDGERILELGAGLGFISALLSLRKAIAEYTLIEADPRLPEVIRKTHELNGVPPSAVVVHNCVLTSEAAALARGAIMFNIDKKFCSSSTIKSKRPLASVSVPALSFHQFLAALRPTCLIVDIEGGELDLFDGSALPFVEKIMMEIHPYRIGQAGVRSVLRRLDASNFVPDFAQSSGVVLAFRSASDTR